MVMLDTLSSIASSPLLQFRTVIGMGNKIETRGFKPLLIYPRLYILSISGISGLRRQLDENGDANANVTVFTVQENPDSSFKYSIKPVAIMQDQRGKLVRIVMILLHSAKQFVSVFNADIFCYNLVGSVGSREP